MPTEGASSLGVIAACDDDLHREMLRLFMIGFLLTLFILWRAFRSSRNGPSHVGLHVTYLIGFWMNHWAALVIYFLPWYCGEQPTFTLVGARQGLYAILGYTAGVTLIPMVFKLRTSAIPSRALEIPSGFRRPMLVMGFVFQIISSRIAILPGLQWVLACGQGFAIVAVILSIWNAVCKRNRRLARQWLIGALFFPFSSLANGGFLGLGIIALVPIVIFGVTCLERKNLFKLALAGSLAGYFLLSVYVTYMRDRAEIRATVWQKQHDFTERLQKIAATFSNFEWFDPYEVRHLEPVDARLNQNWLVGAAVVHTESTQEWATGATLRDAALAAIPRILWPDKPVGAGSGDLVSKYTGIQFDQSTSIGIGQVMEFYVNFGTPMVVLGFFFWGGVLTWLDFVCVRALSSGNIPRFIVAFMVGLPFTQVIGSLVEVVTAVIGSLVLAQGFNMMMNYRGVSSRRDRKPVPVQA